MSDCCADYAASSGISRRGFLTGLAAAGGTLAATRLFGEAVLQTSYAAASGGNTLVVLSLRGGIDGMGVVVPHGDPGYYTARPNTAIPANATLAANSLFGLHPAMAPLLPYWNSGQLAAVHAVGMAVPNRSHFSAIEEIEDASPGSDARVGWVNRMIGAGSVHTPLDAVQVGDQILPTALTGPNSALGASDLSDLMLPNAKDDPDRIYPSMNAAWANDAGPLGRSAREAIAVSQGPGAAINNTPHSGAAYPSGWPNDDLSDALKSAARIIRADVGCDVIAVDYGGWDLHSGYGTVSSGSMQTYLAGFAASLAAFLDDLGPLRSKVTVVTISEFGRRVAENGNRGFDHGWGNMMLLAGAGVKGGQYYGTWPGLDAAALLEGDLQVTTDYRNVLGEVITKRFPGRSISEVFPGLSYAPLGLLT
ncbi:MAG TPA: DUF1501 domain-containing protein [Marmoricola sp.]|nr:DUF1501 domain-containing protein [Marmoricola sp.]HNJ78753.1 DUF1501 domain-containing protein [Marmoricola sp.]HNO38764.1 DUF1501 domain-containing protein [Marmoricola sp.]